MVRLRRGVRLKIWAFLVATATITTATMLFQRVEAEQNIILYSVTYRLVSVRLTFVTFSPHGAIFVLLSFVVAILDPKARQTAQNSRYVELLYSSILAVYEKGVWVHSL